MFNKPKDIVETYIQAAGPLKNVVSEIQSFHCQQMETEGARRNSTVSKVVGNMVFHHEVPVRSSAL